MIESIQFREGVLSLTISLPRRPPTSESERSIQFDFGEGGAITELHRCELMDFIDPVYPEGSHQIRDLVFKLLGTHARVRRIYLNCFYRTRESLEGGTATDEDVKLARGTV
jgi:hypothetical protein